MATPSAPPAWRAVLNIPLANAALSSGAAPTASDDMASMATEINPRPRVPATSTTMGVLGRIQARTNAPAARHEKSGHHG